MKTWLIIWTPIGMGLVYLFLTERTGTFGEFGRLVMTVASLPGVVAVGMVPLVVFYGILKKFGKVHPGV